MNGCPKETSVEDWALAGRADDDTLFEHLATCASCSATFESLSEERALFVRRAPFVPPPPVAIPDVAPSPSRRHAFVTLLACAAAVMGLWWRPAASPSSEAAALTSLRPPAFDEPLACLFPASGADLASDGPRACIMQDRATCEEIVTSSVATP
jgi:hypothetical protein